jgi:hypothetical protein
VFVAVVIQHAKRMGRIILSFVVSKALSYFSILTHKGHDTSKKVTEQKNTCFDLPYILSETLLILRRNE